jgi:hypothetical protein
MGGRAMRIWQRNHAGGNLSARVIEVTDALYHAEAVDAHEQTVTLDDRLRHTLVLAQQRADEMVRRQLDHHCEPALCDEWHPVTERFTHGGRFPLKRSDPVLEGPPENLLIIRRGHTAWADYLGRRLGDLSERVDFLWDRRIGERRRNTAPVSTERRTRDRRGLPPPAWNGLNFILVYSLDPRR